MQASLVHFASQGASHSPESEDERLGRPAPRLAPWASPERVPARALRPGEARNGSTARIPASKRGTAIGAWQRYREIDGPLQSLLLSTYVFLAIVPALIVLEEYLDSSPRALADHLAHHFALSAVTAGLLRSVLVDTRTHELGSALLAIAGALFFGLGFGRVLQLVHVRAWRLELPKKRSDQPRYALVLLGLCGLLLLAPRPGEGARGRTGLGQPRGLSRLGRRC